VLLIGILVSGRTPYLAAFTGISSCAIVGLTTRAGQPRHNWALLAGCTRLLLVLVFGGIETSWSSWHLRRGAGGHAAAGWPSRIQGRIGLPALVEAFSTGAKYALAVGAAAATVGIVIGVVTLTGVGFKLSTIITGAAQAVAGGVGMLVPAASDRPSR
jgi:TRAP-type uncharacterized transport system fused permease subunit